MKDNKEKRRLEIAVYGKGGIGKSTMSANLSAAFAKSGRKVLQIGCDPKHDSTRLLMHGENIRTVLDYIKDLDKSERRIGDVLKKGAFEIGCIEAGGPKPGVGCAGRGIISAFEFLEETGAKDDYDLVVYDVLGDVVCGGFAVPVRREYADAIFLVTSGEYMALYAANNILRGIRNFDGDSHKRVAGIIYNERKLADEDGRVYRFAKSVGLPVLVKVERSDVFARAERENKTVMELDDACELQASFLKLADKTGHDMPLYKACPLSDEDLEAVVLETKRSKVVIETEKSREPVEQEEDRDSESFSSYAEAGMKKRMPLYGCAFTGAITQAIHLTDAIVIAHAPKACAFYAWQNISSPGRKNLFNRGIIMPSALSPNFVSSDMGQAEAVFGGMDRLKASIEEVKKRKPSAIIIVSSCVSGIIGDDIFSLEGDDPECPIITIAADGVIAGDYMEGIRMCMRSMADRFIDASVEPLSRETKEGRMINLIGETGVSNNLSLNLSILRQMLAPMDIKINCRFMGDLSLNELRNLKRAPLNILADANPDNLAVKAYLSQKYGCHFMETPLPIGFYEGKRFLTELGSFFGVEALAAQAAASEEALYYEKIRELKKSLAGKRVLLTTINVNLDWLFDTFKDLSMELVYIGVFNYLHTPLNVSRHADIRAAVREEMDRERIREAIRVYKPDIVLNNYTNAGEKGDYIVDSVPMLMPIGFQTGIHVAKRLVKLLNERGEGEWADDKALFEKYYG